MKLLARLFTGLMPLLSRGWYSSCLPNTAASWFGPKPSQGKSGVPAARRAARKARNRRRHHHGRS